MNEKQGQPASSDTAAIKSRIFEIDRQLHHYDSAISAELHKVTIVVNGRRGRELINEVFMFPPGTIPGELQEFLRVCRDNLHHELTKLLNTPKMMRLGNHIITLADLLKEYTADPDNLSIDPDTVAALQELQPGQSMTILINQEPHQIQRLS